MRPAPILFTNQTPDCCFILDQERLLKNAKILGDLQDRTGVKVLLALKGFAAWDVFPLLSKKFSGPLWGTCASSVDEARLGKEKFQGEVHAFAAAWTEEEVRELTRLVDHLVFNSFHQYQSFLPLIQDANLSYRKDRPIQCGLRINPEHSEGAVAIYNPCAPGSRLGIRKRDFAQAPDLGAISGLHFHTLCEQDSPALARTLDVFENNFQDQIRIASWLNFGGGHHITRPDYNLALLDKLLVDWKTKYNAQIYLEPGEAVALDAGWLTASVLDIVEADIPIAILDISAACHMPDVLEMPYTPNVWIWHNGQPSRADQLNGIHKYRLAGKSCLAGDVIGEYFFPRRLKRGDRLVFQDMAIYSMVKTTTFNGLRLPSIGIIEDNPLKFRMIRQFGYGDFRDRLS